MVEKNKGIMTEEELTEYLRRKQSLTTDIEGYKEIVKIERDILNYLTNSIKELNHGIDLDISTTRVKHDGIILGLNRQGVGVLHIPFIVVVEGLDMLVGLEGYEREQKKTEQKIKDKRMLERIENKLK